MTIATFRFYGELNCFLAPARRHTAFVAPCARAATTKHMIEALGVPHTEVELLLLNGEPATFDRLIADGDWLAVFPHFTALAPGDLARANPPLPRPLRFIADAHLGGLARFLRMAGFDTLYDNAYHDGEIERLAMREHRIVLTRDRDLLKRRGVEYGCYVHGIRPEQQFREVAVRLALANAIAPFTRCLKCNAPLRKVPKADVADRLPARVREQYTVLSTCAVCDGVFWKGSHWQRMNAALAQAAAPPTVSRS